MFWRGYIPSTCREPLHLSPSPRSRTHDPGLAIDEGKVGLPGFIQGLGLALNEREAQGDQPSLRDESMDPSRPERDHQVLHIFVARRAPM